VGRSELVRLLMWEALHARDEELPGEAERKDRYQLKVDAMADSLGCPAGPEAAAILLCLIGLAAWPSAVPQLTRQIVRPQVRSAPGPVGAGTGSGAPGADRAVRQVRRRVPGTAAGRPGDSRQRVPR
jgi:hypothetical protein